MRIVFIFGSSTSLRSFKEFLILESLNSEPSIEIVCVLREHSKYTDRSPSYQPQGIQTYSISGNKNSWSRYQTWVQVEMALRSRDNPAFAEKTRRILLGNLRRGSFSNVILWYLYVASNILRMRSVVTFLGFIPFIGTLISKLTWLLVPNNHSLNRTLIEIKPDLVIVVSNGQESLLAEVQKNEMIKDSWVFLPDNWDNLFTKSVFKTPPAAYFLWSQQQIDFLTKQKYFRNGMSKVYIVGSSRMGSSKLDLDRRQNNVSKLFPKRIKVIYFGQEAPHDEISDIIWMSDVLSRGNLNLEITYRPHPTARPRSSNSSRMNELKNLKFLASGLKILLTIDERRNFALNHNQELLKTISSHDLVVCAPTTVILESLLKLKPTGVLLRDDGKHRSTTQVQWECMPHFRLLENIENFHLIRSENDLNDFLRSDKDSQVFAQGSKTQTLSYFVGPKGSQEDYVRNIYMAIVMAFGRDT